MLHLKFVKLLVEQLGIFEETAYLENTLTLQIRRPGLTVHISHRTKKDCAVCSNRQISGERRQTHYFYTYLEKPRLHAGNCFEVSHFGEIQNTIITSFFFVFLYNITFVFMKN